MEMIGGDAMEGALFYWFTWLGWVWTTFFMEKQNKYRFNIAFLLLILIIASPYKMLIQGVEVYIPAIVLMTFFLIETAKLRNRIFFSVFVTSFIIMLGYVSFLLFELFDPVWVIFDRKWLISISVLLLATALQSEKYLQILSVGIGMLLGEFLFSFTMKSLAFPYPVASPAFLDIVSLATIILGVWVSIQYTADLIGSFMNQGRGKQKSS
ncbi:MAG: YphA family membrane protein [Bacillota bacterium]